jgi:AcrR family transcriptional regulator
MVQVIHSGGNEAKTKEILLAAQKRFGKFGYQKTTMSEIAEDLNLSKASLYYYYPDKESLFRAVFEMERKEFLEQLHEKILQSDDPELLLREFTQYRLKNFRQFNNLGRTSLDEIKGVKIIVKDLWQRFLEIEKEEIRLILEKGVNKGIFKIDDISFTSEFLINALRGLTHINTYHADVANLSNELDQFIEQQVNFFIEIFINGITK